MTEKDHLDELLNNARESKLPGFLTDAGCDHDALQSAVGVLRMQQAQPHKSMQSILWEAIKDYSERAHERSVK